MLLAAVPSARADSTSSKAVGTRRLPIVLYAFSAGGQLADALSTTRALNAGLREGNARMSGLAAHPAQLFTVKAGLGLAAAVIGDQLYRAGQRRHSKVARIGGKLLPVLAGAAGAGAAILNEHRRHRPGVTP